ncbi:hypothetical protein CBS101457_003977 [Exobasidium rhododendri]|nr:hypothetical protein CBS101457_003977 [Exobasidium rhododendri]
MAPIATTAEYPAFRSAPAQTLDFSQWAGNGATQESRQIFIKQLREACSGLGFFYLSNTPLDDPHVRLRERLFQLNHDFFELPLDVRMSIGMENSRHFRGFAKFGDERTLNNTDHRDQIDYGVEVDPMSRELTKLYPFLNLLGPNQFLPDTVLCNHRKLILEWFEICTRLSHHLTEALEDCLGAKAGELLQYLLGEGGLESEVGRRPYARMKTIRYPTASSIDGVERLPHSTQGVGAHRDGGWITILSTSSHRGLQVQSLAGEWLDVPYKQDTVIINFGQQIERVSKGVINAATHRVLSSPSSDEGDRYSIAFFIMPALNSIVKPIDAISPEILLAWQSAQDERRKATGRTDIVSSVPKGDLWGGDEDAFGLQAWKGIVRSHRE